LWLAPGKTLGDIEMALSLQSEDSGRPLKEPARIIGDIMDIFKK
jgi:hypothetical protein